MLVRDGLPCWPSALRFHTSNAGGTDSIPGRGTRIPHATQCGKKIIEKKGNALVRIWRNWNSIHCWGEYKSVQLFCKIIFSNKSKHTMTLWLSNSIPCIYPKEMNAYMHQKMYTSIFIALFIIAKSWKQIHCPSLDEWINYSLYKPQNTAQWKKWTNYWCTWQYGWISQHCWMKESRHSRVHSLRMSEMNLQWQKSE